MKRFFTYQVPADQLRFEFMNPAFIEVEFSTFKSEKGTVVTQVVFIKIGPTFLQNIKHNISFVRGIEMAAEAEAETFWATQLQKQTAALCSYS